MNLLTPAGKEAREGFFTDFFDELQKVPFGSMTKRDLECHLVRLFYKYKLIDTSTNRKAANALGINESRLKNYLIDARYKYQADDQDSNIRNIITKMQEGLHIEPEGENFCFVLEDPILRLDFAQGLKDIGYYTDTSFNTELVKVKKHALFALLLKYAGENKGVYKALAEKAGENDKELREYLKENTTLLDRGKKIITWFKDNPLDAIQIVLGVISLAA
jgi:phage antirepressor YoqD-like protein